MDASMKINLKSWRATADVFEDAADAAPGLVERVVAHTTDPGACGAGDGLATVDGAVAIMLTVFAELMNGTVLPTITDGFRGEAQALMSTRERLVQMDQQTTDIAAHTLD